MSASALTISPTKFNDALEEVERWKRKYSNTQQAAEAKAGLVVTGLTIIAVEAGLGYARGRYGKKEIGGLPAEFWGGATAELAALSGFFGKHSEIVANSGHAALAFTAATEMMEFGAEARAKAEGPKTAVPANDGRQVVQTRGEAVAVEGVAKGPAELPTGQRRAVVEGAPRALADDIGVVANKSVTRRTGT